MTENLSNETGTQRIAEDDSEWFETLFQPLGTDHAIPTPYQDMNEILAGGLRPGELTVITGRPSMGKTALALDLARHAALRHDIGSLYVSLDSPPSNVWERIYSAQSRTPYRKLRHRKLEQGDQERLRRTRAELEGRPLRITAEGPNAANSLKGILWMLQNGKELPRLVVVDHIGLMDGFAEDHGPEAAIRRLKRLALEWEAAVVAVCPLGRPKDVWGRQPRAEELPDGVWQTADVVIGVHREDYYSSNEARAGEADLIFAKNRNGPTATMTVACQLHYSRFADMAE